VRLTTAIVAVFLLLLYGCDSVSPSSTSKVINGRDTIRYLASAINRNGARASFVRRDGSVHNQRLAVVENTFFAEHHFVSDGRGSLSFDLELVPTISLSIGDIRRLYIRCLNLGTLRDETTHQVLNEGRGLFSHLVSHVVIAEYVMGDKIVRIGGGESTMDATASVTSTTSSEKAVITINVTTPTWQSNVTWDFFLAP
jgi:hypothetical protein